MASGAGGEDQGRGDHGGLSASGPATPAPPPSKGKHIVPPTLGCKVLLIRSGLKAAGRRAERAGGSPAAERLGKAREKQPEGSAGRAFTFPGFLCFSPTALSNRQWLDFFMPLRGWAKTRRCGVWGGVSCSPNFRGADANVYCPLSLPLAPASGGAGCSEQLFPRSLPWVCRQV